MAFLGAAAPIILVTTLLALELREGLGRPTPSGRRQPSPTMTENMVEGLDAILMT